jgi:late competence protein required for DNA uptake (superfamily II DNA/RNA helicase)
MVIIEIFIHNTRNIIVMHKRTYFCPKCKETNTTGFDDIVKWYPTKYCRNCKVKHIVSGECGKCGENFDELCW